MAYNLIRTINSGDNSEVRTTIPLSVSPFTKYVIYSIDLNSGTGGDLAVGDQIVAQGEFEVTTNEPSYNTGCWAGFVLADSATATTGTEISEFNGGNVTPGMHHMQQTHSGTFVIADASKRYLNLVAYAGGSSATTALDLEPDYGRITCQIFRDPAYTAPTTSYRYLRLRKTNAAAGGFYHTEMELYDASGKLTLSTGMFTESGLQGFNATALINGSTASPNAFYTDTSGVGSYLKIDMGAGNAKTFNKVRLYVNGEVPATWEIQGSNDDTTYTTLATGFNVSGGAGWKEKTF